MGVKVLSAAQIAEEQRVAFLALAAIGNVEDREPLVFGRADGVEALRVRLVLVNQLVVRLRRADLVVIDLVILVLRRQLLARLGSRIAAVEEAVVLPGDAGDLHPLQFVRQRLPARDVHHVEVVPV